MDNLALSYYDRSAFGCGHLGDLERALELEAMVFSVRTERLGKESLYTLWSGLNLAKMKAAHGETEEALAIFLPGHRIAERNLGKTHFGFLLGEMHYGRILMYAGRFAEAEKILDEANKSYEQSNRKGHPDHLLAMFSLLKCRNILGIEGQDQLFERLKARTEALFGIDHAAVRYLLNVKSVSEDDFRPTEPSEAKVPRRVLTDEDPEAMDMIAKYGHI